MSPCFNHLVIVLPCHSLEDFPIHHRGPSAANLLACWTGLWHPTLLHDAQRLPVYHPAGFTVPDWLHGSNETQPDDAAETPSGPEQPSSLVVIPEVAQTLVESEFLMTLGADAVIIENPADRNSLVAAAIARYPSLAMQNQQVDSELAEDMMALGYAYLQVQLMTRQLRYSSNLDEPEFCRRVLAAADAIVAATPEDAKDRITEAYDLLLEEKNSYYPVEPQLLDLSLVVPKTSSNLQDELSQLHPQNLLLSGELAARLKQDDPDTSEVIRQRVTAGTVSIVGGLHQESPSLLMSSESILSQLHRGCETIEQVFGKRPQVFARRKFGLHPSLPNLLQHSGYIGAIHATFDGGVFPRSANGVMRWTGDDDEAILTLADTPLDASDTQSFVGLGIKLGEMIDSAHMASALFVHWPGQTCQAFEDLKRITTYTSLFGDFFTLDQFFETAYDPGFGDQFAADEYRTPYLKQAIAQQQQNPISRWIDYWQQLFRLQGIQHLGLQIIASESNLISAAAIKQWQQLANRCQQAIDRAAGSETGQQAESTTLLAELHSLTQNWMTAESSDSGNDRSSREQRLTCWVWPADQPTLDVRVPAPEQHRLINLTSARQRVLVAQEPGSKNGSLKHTPPVWLAQQDATGSQWVVEIPAFGSATITQKSLQPASPVDRDPPIAEELRLQNEYFYVEVDPDTGGLRNIGLHGQRVNLLGQQLAVRIPTNGTDRKQPARYTNMICRDARITHTQKLSAAIKTAGVLVDNGQLIADYQQTIHIARAMSRIQFDVQLDLKQPLEADPNHYACCRFAWKDESASITANSIDGRQPVTTQWFHATQFISIGDDPTINLLMNGLPYHRRANRRMLDTLLISHGESRRQFQFAIDIDQRYGLTSNRSSMCPPAVIPVSATTPQCRSHWWFHLNCKNVIATHCHPESDGQTNGVVLRLKETEGRMARVVLRSRRGLSAAWKTDFMGNSLQTLEVANDESDQIKLEIPPFALVQLKLQFKP